MARKIRKKSPHRFEKGNEFWKQRSSHGAKPIFDNAKDLYWAAMEYFQWCESNPLEETKLFHYRGQIFEHVAKKARAFTLQGLHNHLDIHPSTWKDWRDNRVDLSETIARIESIVQQQKLELGYAELINPNLVSMELGLRDARNKPLEDEEATEIVYTRAVAKNA